LLASTVIAGMAFANPAFAQGQQPVEAVQGDEAVATNPDADMSSQEEIVVTGSLIRNPNLERSAPVNTTSSDEIELLQSNVAEEILREIPGVVPSIGSAVNNGNGGASFVNLRGLGANRNLVLIDGNRLVPAGLAGVFDLNNIPLALVERVDVLTGGASTTYGADAISGVVNFITKNNFAGLEISASEQITERGDGNVFRVDATIGANFDDNRGNAVLSIGYQESDAIFQGERDVSLTTLETFGGTALGSGTSVPSRFSVPGSATQQINPATGALVPTFATFNFNPFNVFQTPFERFNIYGAANYEVSDAVEVYTRGLFSKNTVDTIIAPSGAFGIAVQIPLSNPFLPAAARARFCANNDSNPNLTGIQTLTPEQCAAAALATSPTDPNFREITTSLFRRSVEAGPRTSEYKTTFFDYRIGLRGDITSNIGWDISGAYGESENDQTIGGYFTNSRVRQSLRATNTTTCLDTSNGCVPANFFGAAGSISPEAVDFIVQESSSFVSTSLAQARALLNGDLGFTSPLGTDPIAFAVGGEYRNYQAAQGSDTLAASGDLGGAGGATPGFEGGYDVYEGVAEIVVPLIQERPFFKNLTVEAGVRYSEYSVDAPTNPKYDTLTYKAGGTWEVADGFTIRGNYARAVRAPNIAELFSPVNTGLTNLGVDPCATLDTAGKVLNGRPAGGPTGELRAVCLAQGANASNINTIAEPISGQVLSTGGGNLNIRPEKSDSYTIGVILQPSFVPGFTATVDYYNIKIREFIGFPTPGDAIAACFGADIFNPPAGASSNPACTAINRDPQTGGLSGDPNTSTGLPLTLSNGGSAETDGIDVVLNYRRDLGFARLNLGFNGNYTLNSKFNAFVLNPTSVNRECTSFISSNCGSLQPKYQFSQRTTLSFENVDLSLLWRHISSFRQEPLDADPAEGSGPFFSGTIGANIPGVGGTTDDFGRINARDYFDLSARFSVTENMVMTLTVQNLLDSDPPITGNNAGSTTFNSGNTFPSTFDAVGRRYAASVRLKF
jgi:outer membrane receptor protein involved in Fe transport